MDFLKDLAIPQSTEHFHLLLFMLNLVLIVLMPYLGFLAGASVLSVLRCGRGRRQASVPDLRFAKDLAGMAVFSMRGVTFLALIPAFSLVFILAQLLQSTPAIAVSLMAYGFLALLIGVILLNVYRYTFQLSSLLQGVEHLLPKGRFAQLQQEASEVVAFARSNSLRQMQAGRYGVAFLIVATVLIVGAVTVATDPPSWTSVGSIFDLFVSPHFLFRFLQFVAMSLGATGVGILFFFFSWNGGRAPASGEYEEHVRPVAIRLAVGSLLLQPVLILATVAVMPSGALSGVLFGITGLCLVLLFLTAHFIYAYRRENRIGYVSYAFYALLLALTLLFTMDQVAISHATRGHAAHLSVVYDRGVEELKSRLGVAAAVMSGQEIYDAKCSACHLFDQKKVGPPYKEVVPKYEGKKALLISFVLNPLKVNPEYPPMPNQGLKPAEADSIASFLLAKYSEKAAAAGQAPGR